MRKENLMVAAVVVTYNRLDYLQECLASLRTQSYKNYDIIVVNNGSTDGTSEYLNKQTDLIVIHQENIGGAGGFYSGMKYMHEHKKYDALWMMDDDGLADPEQLANLITYSQKYKIFYCNALVVNRTDRTKLCASGAFYDKKRMDAQEFIFDTMMPFNGTFCYRQVIDKIGYIKKEMFIWGDEREYLLRVKSNGFKIGTVTKAIHYHPVFKGKGAFVIPFFNKWYVSIKPRGFDRNFYRNLGYIDKTYKKNYGLYYKLYFLSRLRIKDYFYFLKYYKLGEKNDYHQQFGKEI